jgi:hypothetical protein
MAVSKDGTGATFTNGNGQMEFDFPGTNGGKASDLVYGKDSKFVTCTLKWAVWPRRRARSWQAGTPASGTKGAACRRGGNAILMIQRKATRPGGARRPGRRQAA